MMEEDDIEIVGTVADSLRELLEQDNDVAFEYLTVSFLSSAITALFYARRRAGLTQAQLAERLHTKQSAIARMEADVSGSVSLRRYAEYARACGVVPLDIELEPVGAMRAYALADPEAPRTGAAYHAWQARTSRTTSQEAGNQQTAEARPPDALLAEVLENIDAIENASTGVAVLRLVEHCLKSDLPEPLLTKALDEVLQTIGDIENESTRSAVLRMLAFLLKADLPESLLAKSLDAANGIEGTGLRAWTLNALTPKLPEALQGKAREYLETALEAIARAEDPHSAMPVQHSLDRPA